MSSTGDETMHTPIIPPRVRPPEPNTPLPQPWLHHPRPGLPVLSVNGNRPDEKGNVKVPVPEVVSPGEAAKEGQAADAKATYEALKGLTSGKADNSAVDEVNNSVASVSAEAQRLAKESRAKGDLSVYSFEGGTTEYYLEDKFLPVTGASYYDFSKITFGAPPDGATNVIAAYDAKKINFAKFNKSTLKWASGDADVRFGGTKPAQVTLSSRIVGGSFVATEATLLTSDKVAAPDDKAQTGQVADAKATHEQLDAVRKNADSVEERVTTVESEIKNKASASFVNALTQKTDALQKSKADKTELESVESRVTEIEKNGSAGGLAEFLTPITHAELLTLRNNSQLVPGMQYRITDYVATTKQSNTKSANHPFDIIVTADDEDKLNEAARAIRHEGDTYFANCKLESWKIWYCLDNDTNRFAWATSSEEIDGVAVAGKGVIYRMIDEWDNDVPYDFKGILTKAYIDGSWSSDYRYTFGGSRDETVKARSTCYSNKMGVYITSSKQKINQNSFGSDCSNNSFGPGCYDNSFGSDCSNNSFDSGCYGNSFGLYCTNNSFDSGCYDNSFGSYCSNNSFGSDCSNNSFGSYCSNNSFGLYCTNNSFDSGCYDNSFGLYCTNNSFGSDCSNNSFDSGCYGNSFGSDCSNNSFGSGCSNNTFGADEDTPLDYYQYITFGNGCKGLNLYCTASTSREQVYKNVEIKSGVTGEVDEYGDLIASKTITDDNVNQSFHTTYKPVGSMEVSV